MTGRTCFRNHNADTLPCPNIWCESHGLWEAPGVPAFELHCTEEVPLTGNLLAFPQAGSEIREEPDQPKTVVVEKTFIRIHRWDQATGAEWWTWGKVSNSGITLA